MSAHPWQPVDRNVSRVRRSAKIGYFCMECRPNQLSSDPGPPRSRLSLIIAAWTSAINSSRVSTLWFSSEIGLPIFTLIVPRCGSNEPIGNTSRATTDIGTTNTASSAVRNTLFEWLDIPVLSSCSFWKSKDVDARPYEFTTALKACNGFCDCYGQQKSSLPLSLPCQITARSLVLFWRRIQYSLGEP